MDEVLLISFGYSIALVVIAVFVGFCILRVLDKLSGIDFKGWAQNASSLAMAIYLGLRLIAVCALLGLILS